MLGNGLNAAFSAIAAAQREIVRPVAPSPVTGVLAAQQSIVKQMVPKLGVPMVNSWVSPITAFQQQLANFTPWVAHHSAGDTVANLMQDLAEMWVIPRQQGLANIMGRFWLQAITAASDVVRSAIEEVTGQRARIDRLSPVRRRGPNRHAKRRSVLVLGFAEQHYAIKELLIRAPGSDGPSVEPPQLCSGEDSWQLKDSRPSPQTTTSARTRTSISAGADRFPACGPASPSQVATPWAC